MKKLLSTTIAVGIFASMSITPVMALDVNALPQFNATGSSNVDVTTNGNAMNVQIQGGQYAVGVANWDTFNIGKDASVNFEFTAHNQTSLNKVNSAGGMSQIYGKITDSGCYGCGYAGTGKIIILNPNGFLFGDGANVNVNSFTASTMPGTYDQSTRTLTLTKGDNSVGIKVLDGAKIYGDKNVAFAAGNVEIYKGSQISTNTTAININEDTALGKVKIVTADGVNFTYYNNQAVEAVSGTASADKMTLHIAGDIQSGHIDARNLSTHSESELNTNEAILKAYKAEIGSDGNIWLTANNKVITEKTDIVAGGNVKIKSANKSTLNADVVSADGNVTIIATAGGVNVDGSIVGGNNITLEAGDIASIQNGSKVTGKDVTIKGVNRSQIVEKSSVNATNVNIESANVWFDRANVKATNSINAKATTGYVLANGASSLDAPEITLDAATNVTGSYDLHDNATTIKAGNDINVTLANVSNPNAGLVAEAGKNVTIATDGTLSVSRLVAADGDMTLTANNLIKGTPLNNIKNTGYEVKFGADAANDQALISVENGTFTSNIANNNFDKDAAESGAIVGDKTMKHNISYGNEKVLLINPWDYVAPAPTPTPVVTTAAVTVDDGQAAMLNRVPRQPEAYSNTTRIADGRTTFVDVFAAASQIEIEDDEE